MKRSMNVNIILKQFKRPNADIVQLLVDGDHEAVGQEKLRGLLKILPEKDEVKLYWTNFLSRYKDPRGCLTIEMSYFGGLFKILSEKGDANVANGGYLVANVSISKELR